VGCLLATVLVALVALGASQAHAAVYSYVDWTSADPSMGTAFGTITLPDDSKVTASTRPTG
jgi:hypothetical protein